MKIIAFLFGKCKNTLYIYIIIITQKLITMKTQKANAGEWREQVMKALKLDYTIDSNNKMVYKGDLKGYKTLVDLLVSERIKLGILPY